MQKIDVSEMFPSDSLPDKNMGVLVRKLEELKGKWMIKATLSRQRMFKT